MGKHLRGQRYVGGYFSKRLTFTPQKRGFEVYLHFSHQIIVAPKSNGAKDSLLLIVELLFSFAMKKMSTTCIKMTDFILSYTSQQSEIRG